MVDPAINGQKHFRGRIEGVEDDVVLFLAEGNKAQRLPRSSITRAKLDVEF